ncbi:MAG: hypothetical protein NTW19_23525 [Planctomycetota bacterium]|nr:hypothetical protein [Planctomycetota bacterium]
MWTPRSSYEEAFAAAKARGEFLRAKSEHIVQLYVGQVGKGGRTEVARVLGESNRGRLAAAPDLQRYPELIGMRELIEAEWRGTRDGAGLDDAQAEACADGNYFLHRVIASGRFKPKAHCSVAYFPTSDHGALLASNLDTDINEPYTEPTWPLMNEHLIMGGVSSGVFLDEESPETFPAPVFKLIARYCWSTDEAVEMLTRYNLFWGPGNHIVIDRRGRVAMIEKSACRIGVRHSKDGFGFTTAMVSREPGMKAFLADRRAASLVDRKLPNPCADTRYWAAQDVRQEIMTRLLDDARKAPTLEKMRALMQYRGPDGVVCDNGDVLHPGDPPIEHTIRTMIVCLSKGRALWWTRDNERNIPSWQNRREDVVFKDVLLWP